METFDQAGFFSPLAATIFTTCPDRISILSLCRNHISLVPPPASARGPPSTPAPPPLFARCVLVSLATDDIIESRAGSEASRVEGGGGVYVHV